MIPKRIGFIGFDGVVAIDLAGPVEAFDCAQIPGGQNGQENAMRWSQLDCRPDRS